MPYQYKTKDGQNFFIPGVGQTVDGILTSDTIVENPNLELVREIESTETVVPQAPEPQAPAAPVAPAPQPAPAPLPAQPTPINTEDN